MMRLWQRLSALVKKAGSFHVLSVAGTAIQVHFLFLVVIFLLGLAGRLAEALLLFATVFLHELAHVVVAKRLGLTVNEIRLLPFGGVARIEELVQLKPLQELTVALAGPLSNMFMIGVLQLLSVVIDRESGGAPLLMRSLIEMNAVMALFNMLPALPLDGGRVFRSLLTYKLGYRRATNVTVIIGKALAVAMVVSGGILLYRQVLSVTAILIGLFVYAQSEKERRNAHYVLMQYLSAGRNVLEQGGPRVVCHLAAPGSVPVKDVIHHMNPTKYFFIWVVSDQGEVTEVISETQLAGALFDHGINTSLSEAAKWRKPR